MTEQEFLFLIDKHLANQTTDQEKQQLINFTSSFQHEAGCNTLPEDFQTLRNTLYERVTATQPLSPVRRISFTTKWRWIAAILILAIGSGIYYFNLQSYKSNKSSQITVQTKEVNQEIPPGTNRATLTLSNGTQKQLTLADNGLQLQSDAVLLTTPNGGQYQAILPDGSKVWLNAASSIKFPSAFSNKERRVEITGEVYFEIAKDVKRPFLVSGGGQEIEVLGTSFNINVYQDEPIEKTTLITGSIKITSDDKIAILKPGQQASISIIPITQIKQITVQTTNIEQDIAWKNGLFDFNNLNSAQVMNQLARWYNIDIAYEGTPPTIEFWGKLSRRENLATILTFLEKSGIDFRMENNGRKLIVTKKQ